MDIQEFFTTNLNALEFKKKYLPQLSDVKFYDKLKGFNMSRKQVFFTKAEVKQIRKGLADMNFKAGKIVDSIPTLEKLKLVFTHKDTGETLSFTSVQLAAKELRVSRGLIYQQMKNDGLVKKYKITKHEK